MTERSNLSEWSAAIRVDLLNKALEFSRRPAPRGGFVPGGMGAALTVVDALVVLYLDILQHRPALSAWPLRDRVVFSKVSAWPAYHSLLYRLGYLNRPREWDEPLDMNADPGVDFSSTGAGVGLSAAVGMALGLRLDNKKSRVFALMESSELGGGETWEAVDRAGIEKLSRLCAVVDWPRPFAGSGAEESGGGAAAAEKFRAFGWESVVVDGHSHEELSYAFSKFKKTVTGRPVVVIAQTRFGKGVAALERTGTTCGIDQLSAAVAEMSESLKGSIRA